MLRTIFVLLIAAVGTASVFAGPFNGLLYYLWIAHFRPEAWVWDDFVRTLNLSLIAGVMTVGAFLFSRERFKLDRRSSLLFAFLLQSLISTLLSPYVDYSWPYFVDFAKSTVMTYLIAMMVTDQVRLRRVVLVIALSLGFEATKQGWLQLILNPGAKNANELVTLGDNNGVAVGMLMLLGLLVALAGTTEQKWERRGYQFMSLGVLYRGLSTYSRGGMVGCVAIAIWYLVRSKQKFFAIVSLTVACGLILPVLPSAFWDRMSTINSATEDINSADDSIRGRVHFWGVAMAMANERPLTGVGHNAFVPAYNRYDYSEGAFGTDRSVHNSWMGILAELGYSGLLIFIAILSLAFTACFKARRVAARGGPKFLETYAFGFEIGLVAFGVAGTFVIFQYTELLWHCIGLTMALYALAVKAEQELDAANEQQALATLAAAGAAA